jgi:Flp pilus assembly protein CpaB
MSMGRRRTLVLGGIVVIALAVAGAVLVWRQRGGGAQPGPEEITPEPVPVVTIVVAINNLDRGTELREGLIEAASWPQDRLPPYYESGVYYEDPEEVYGFILRTFVPQGMPLMRSMLAERAVELEEGGSDISLSIPPGKRALAIPIDLLGGVAWLIQPGDHVDVLASWTFVELDEDFQTPLPNKWVILACPEGYVCHGTMGRQEILPTGEAVLVYPEKSGMSRYIAQLTIQDAIVLEVGLQEPQVPEVVEGAEEAPAEPTPPPPIQNVQPIVLLVDAQDALVLKALFELEANIDLALRNATDSEPLATLPVTLEYIMERYEMEVPPKLPYGVTSPPVNVLEVYYKGEQEGETPTE